MASRARAVLLIAGIGLCIALSGRGEAALALVLFIATALGFILALGWAAGYGLVLGCTAAWTMPAPEDSHGWPANLVTLALCVVLACIGSLLGAR